MVELNSYFQGSNRDADIGNGYADMVRGINWRLRLTKYTLPCVKSIARGKL